MSRAGREKPVAALAFRRGGRAVLPVLPAPPRVMPDPPTDVGETAVDAWSKFWSTEVSGAVNMARDGERLRHWCRCIDVREKLWNDYRMEAHPKWQALALREIRYISKEIDDAERLFGMTPLYKMRLTGALDVADKAEENIKARHAPRRLVEA